MRSRLFATLPYRSFVALLERVERQVVASGEVLVEEGADADAFFVLVSGRLEVFTRARDGSEVHLAAVEEGEHFGEQAILHVDPAPRTASIRGVSPQSEVARIGIESFQSILAHSPGLRGELEALGRHHLQNRMARRTDLVRQLLGDVAIETSIIERSNGDVLFRQGDTADRVFVVLSGAVELLTQRDGVRVHLARVGSGLPVGLDSGETRENTAVVDDDTRLLVVPRDALQTLEGEAGAHLAVLDRVWDLPQRGFVTQHLGSVDGRSCVTQVFRMVDGRTVVSSHAIDSGFVRLVASDEDPARTLATPDGSIRIGVSHAGMIHTVEAGEAGPAVPVLFGRGIEGKPLTPGEEASLTRTGELHVADEGFACTCLRVTRARVQEAVASGVTDLEMLQTRTGCGMSCGSCVPGLRALLGQKSFERAILARRTEPAPGVVRVTLAGSDETYASAKPGQHVVLRASIEGTMVERPYTLSGAAGGPREITVKRIPGGVFSNWLFDAPVGTEVECSNPGGSYVWEVGPEPVVCFAGGIGITPALAFARTMLLEGRPNRLVIDWSTRDPSDLTLLEELASVTAPNLMLRTRVTSRDGRLQRSDVACVAERFVTAAYFLCGSESFMATVSDWLCGLGVPDERIHIEAFHMESSP